MASSHQPLSLLQPLSSCPFGKIMGDAAEIYLFLFFFVLPLLLLILLPVYWGCRRLFPEQKVECVDKCPEVCAQLFSGTPSSLRYAGVLFVAACFLVINFELFQPKLEGVRRHERPPCQGPIDVLITWVDTSDPEWQDEGNAAGCNIDHLDSEGGDIDPYEALRFQHAQSSPARTMDSKYIHFWHRAKTGMAQTWRACKYHQTCWCGESNTV